MTHPDIDRVCVVIGRTRHKMVQLEIQEAAKQGARLIEVRLDFLSKAPDFKRLLSDKPCALIATCRRPVDGGKWSGSEEARTALLRQAIVAGFDWVDLETDIADHVRRFGKVQRIVSYHNFRETPADLEKIYQRMAAQDADILKLAVKAQAPADNLRVLGLLNKAPKPTVAFCLGDIGFPSRILGLKFGAPFLYAAFNRERLLAPGMPWFNEVKSVYAVERIGPETKVFAVVGDPVSHSLSPLIHNLAFRKAGVDAIYLPIRVPRDGLGAALQAFEQLPIDGYSVTIPHKEAAARLAQHRDVPVQRIGAANTLVRTRAQEGSGTRTEGSGTRTEGSGTGWMLSASNTDYQGVIEAINAFLPVFATRGPLGELAGAGPAQPIDHPEPGQHTLHNRVVLVLGAGGVARAVAFALVREGALVTITNRTPERAQALAHELGCRNTEWNARHSVLCDLVVNCTSVGMHPHIDESPLHPSYLKPGLIVFDTVYTPEQTLLIKEARDRGCHVITGVELFVRQAALQFHQFTGQPAPVELIRKVVKRALSPVALKGEDEKE